MTTANRSPDHWQCGKSLQECLGYLLDNILSCDVTFHCGEMKLEVKAHKTLLIARSPVFHTMFDGPMKEEDLINLPDINADTFKIFLRYVYTDMVDLTGDNVISILYVAKKYCVESLSRKCFNFLKASLSDENACLIYEQAHIYDERELQEKCYEHIMLRPMKSIRSESFQDLCPVCCDTIIASDEQDIKEEVIYEAMLKWSDAECHRRNFTVDNENRRKVLGHLLYKIRFPLIDIEYFAKNILKQDILSDKEKLFVFESHFNVSDDSAAVFNSRSRFRKNTLTDRFLRFHTVLKPGEHGRWVYQGTPDSVCFKVNIDMALYGVVLYGDHSGSVYNVKLEIINDQNHVLSTVYTEYTVDPSNPICDILLDVPVKIAKDRQYKVRANIFGPTSCWGWNGYESKKFKNISIKFLKSNDQNNCTDFLRGQIPGLLLVPYRGLFD